MRKFKFVLACGVAVAAFVPVAAQAQAQQAGAGAAQEETGIEDIVVTAQRREESLQKAAIAVSAVSADALAAKGVSNVFELTKMVPAVKIGQTANAGVQVTIRGVGNFGGNNYGEPGVAINVDGVYFARSTGPSGIFYDVDRVEILKGPQGTLYGRNSTGGVVNVITKKPTYELGADFTGEVGNYDLFRGTGMVNVPLGDKVAIRLSGQGVSRNGFLSDGYADDKNYAGRFQVRFDPTNDLSINLSADLARTKGKGLNGVFVPYLDPSKPYTGPSSPASNALIDSALGGAGAFVLPDITADGFSYNSSWGVGGTIEYKLPGMVATVIASHRELETRYTHFSAGFPVSDDTINEPSLTTTLEARLASDNDSAFKWVIGGFYYDDKLTTNIYPEQGVTFSNSNIDVKTTSYSGFAQGTYSITDSIRFTAGGRYTSDKKTISGYIDSFTSDGTCPPIPGVTLESVFRPYTNSNAPVCRALVGVGGTSTKTFDKFTWKLGLDADIGPQSLAYASVATGFKAGGFFGAGEPNSYAPEELTAYTVGIKNRFADNKLQLNFEAYYWDYKDKQTVRLGPIAPFGYNLRVDNAGSATIKGFEIEALFKPTNNDLITVNYQYNHTKYGSFKYDLIGQGPVPASSCPYVVTAGLGSGVPALPGGFNRFNVDCSGRVLPFSPRSVLNLAYQHTFDLAGGSTVVFGASTHIESSFQVGEEYLPGQTQKASMVSDLDLTWNSAKKNYFISGYVQNLENEAVAQTGFVQPILGRPLNTLRPPRTYGVRFGAKF